MTSGAHYRGEKMKTAGVDKVYAAPRKQTQALLAADGSGIFDSSERGEALASPLFPTVRAPGEGR